MKYYYLISLFAFSLFSCSNENALCVFDVENVEDFQDVVIAKSDTTFVMNNMHVKDFRIVDSLIIFDTNDKVNSWKISKTDIIQPFAGLFKVGHSSGEFIWTPSVRRSQFFRQDNDLSVVVYDFGNGNVYRSKIINDVCDSSINEIKSIKVDPNMDNLIYISDNEYIYRKNTFETRAKQLVWIKNGKKCKCESFEKLNKIEVPAEDYNSLAAFTHYSPENNVLVQAYKYFNIINLIYPNEDKGKCLCIGDKTINGSSVFLNRRRESFSDDMLVYKDYFVVLSQIDGKSNLGAHENFRGKRRAP